MTQFVRVDDERNVRYEACGPASGFPVFLLHGTPGSHCGPKPRPGVLSELGIRLISYDRPGYGASTRHKGRVVADAAHDVAAIADALGDAQFAVVGRSGGGPHALACAAKLPGRVLSVAVLVGLAPSDAKNLMWFEGMASSNVREYEAASEAVNGGRADALAELKEQAARVRADPASLIEHLDPDLTGSDKRVVHDIAIRKQLTDSYAEALRDGVDGWIDDVIALRMPWGFELSEIDQPVLLWHGAQDSFSPVGHAFWLRDQIRHAVMEVASGTSHFGAVETLPKTLAWVKQSSRDAAGASVRTAEGQAYAPAGAPY